MTMRKQCLMIAVAVSMISTIARAADKLEVDYKADITYGKAAGEDLKLDVASPKGLDHAVPAVVLIHGGGWTAGKRQDMSSLAKDYAAHGYVGVTISYRFTPKHQFPAQIEDSKCAVRYLRAHAKELNIDPKRIGAMGISAGAHLSMMLGTMDSADGLEGDGGNPDQSSKVQAVVSFVGPVNLVIDNYTDAQSQILEAFVGGKPKEKVEECRRASPITYINKGDAPMLCFFGSKDPLINLDQAYQITTALNKAEVPGRVEVLLGAGHGWVGPELKRSMDDSMAFFELHLKPSAN
jgi:acetyl esterase/lipase